MTRIHPTALVDPKAQLDPSVEVGPYAIIEAGVTIGARTIIGPHAWLRSGTTMGCDNHVHYGAIIGHWPQDLAFTGGESFVRIGDGNQIREYATIHRGTKPGSATTVGDHCFLIGSAHLAHNCTIGHHVIIANNALLAGYVEVEDHAFISGHCAVHQFTRIGRLAILSGMTVVTKDIPPYCLAALRNHVAGLNVVGLRRAGLSPAVRAELKQAFRLLYLEGLNLAHALTQMEQVATSAEAKHLVAFLRQSKRGICPHRRQTADNSLEEEELHTG